MTDIYPLTSTKVLQDVEKWFGVCSGRTRKAGRGKSPIDASKPLQTRSDPVFNTRHWLRRLYDTSGRSFELLRENNGGGYTRGSSVAV